MKSKEEKDIELKNDKEKTKNIVIFVIILINILASGQILTGGISMIKYGSIIINILLITSLFIIFGALTKKVKLSLLITNIIILIIAIIDYILVEIRQMPLFFSDIFVIRAAINVADKYDVNFKWYFFLGIADFFVNLFLIYKLKFNNEIESKIKKRYSLFGIAIIVIIWLFITPNMYFETNLSDNRYGVLYRFLKTSKDIFIDKPKGYTKEKTEEILSKYEINEEEINDDKPNVIVIMNESLADLNSVYNLGFKDNLTFTNGLSRGTDLYSSVYAGRTANSEFEFLTGISTIFYGANVPYQQYIRNNIYCFPRIMKENGYKTSAMHLYFSTSYNREKIYDYMGFDESIFDDNAYNLDIQKMAECDKNVYKKIINMFENKEENEKLFNFCITVQNHMPYSIDLNRYTLETEQVKKTAEEFQKILPNEYYTDNEKLNGYLNFAKMSDEAFEELVKYFENYDEKVVILMFGDHQPEIKDKNLKTNNDLDKYRVSYALWSNYDIGEYSIKETSINYLPVILSDIINIKTPAYFNFLKNLRNELPVITANGYKDKEGNWHKKNDKSSKYYDLINKYNYIEYYYMNEDIIK